MERGEEIGGRPPTANPPGEGARKHSAAAFESQRRAEWQRLKAQIRGLNKPLRITAHLRPTIDALQDPRFGESVLQLLMECGVSAIKGGPREYHGCCQRWSLDRSVVAIGVVEFLTVKGEALVGLCPECWDRPDRLQIAIAGLERDFGLGLVGGAPIHDGGRA